MKLGAFLCDKTQEVCSKPEPWVRSHTRNGREGTAAPISADRNPLLQKQFGEAAEGKEKR